MRWKCNLLGFHWNNNFAGKHQLVDVIYLYTYLCGELNQHNHKFRHGFGSVIPRVTEEIAALELCHNFGLLPFLFQKFEQSLVGHEKFSLVWVLSHICCHSVSCTYLCNKGRW
jgi:hypothetical protein